MKIDKSQFKDSGGRYLTQSLFLEFNYNTDFAVYTFDGEDKEYKGKVYPSLKRLYLEAEDLTEYTFARQHLFNWEHWMKMKENKALRNHFDAWAEELEVYLRSQGLRSVVEMSEHNFQAAKFLSEKGWEKRGVGRPSKSEQAREDRIRDSMSEYSGDIVRLKEFK